MITAHTYVVGVGSIFETGSIIVTPFKLPYPSFEWKGSKEVTNGFFPLLGVISSGSFRRFASWEDLEHEFEEDGLKSEHL